MRKDILSLEQLPVLQVVAKVVEINMGQGEVESTICDVQNLEDLTWCEMTTEMMKTDLF